MSSTLFKQRAYHILAQHDMTPECLLQRIAHTPTSVTTFTDSKKEVWSFISRRRCRLFLLAKTSDMNKYEDVYCSTNM